MKFYYRTAPSPTLPLGSSNPVGTVKPLKHGNVAPKWTKRGRTHPFLIVLKYKVADFFFSMVQSNPDSIGKRRGWGQERENQSGERRVRDGTGRKIYIYIYIKKTELKRVWWWLGKTLNQLVIPAQEVGGTWGKKKHKSRQWQRFTRIK